MSEMKPLKYIKIFWNQEEDEYPIEIYAKLDNDNYEVKRVEFFKNGKVAYADENIENGTYLSPAQYTDLNEFNVPNGMDDVFATEISEDEFNEAWLKRNAEGMPPN
jgi:hypothetical protein